MKQQLIKKSALLLLFLANIFSLVFSQGVVCRLQKIAGFETEYIAGHTICGNNTNSMADVKMYLTVSNDNLYIHSNYLTPGFQNPTKLATSEPVKSFEDLATNIFFDRLPTESSIAEMNAMLKNNVEIIIDPALINDSKFGSLNFNNINNLKVYCPDYEVRKAVKIRQKNGVNEIGVKVNDVITIRIKEQNLNFIFSELRNQKIDFNNLKIINLVDNSSTKNVLSQNFSGKSLAFDFSTKENFKNALLQNKGNRTVIIGHIENGDFVTVNNAGKEVFRISLAEIETFQKENKLELILMGCNSATEGAGSGVLGKFNSVDAIKGLKEAEQAKNVEEFLEKLSSNNLHFVIDETFFNINRDISVDITMQFPEKIELSVFDNLTANNKTVNYNRKKGTIIILGLGTAGITAVNSPVTDSAATNTNDTTLYIPDYPDKPKSSSGSTTFWVLLTLAGIGTAAYFINKSKKS